MPRLTFVGDIALDKPLLKAAKKRGNGEFDFSDVFHTEDVFADSDLVIGNLETCFGGGHHFNTKPYHYNSPDSFCRAIRDAGIGLVSTANNHCMDEGVKGLQRTLQQLDACRIEHTGTFAAETDDRFLVKGIKGLWIAFYSLTFSVNVCIESLACDDLYRFVNLTGFSGMKKGSPQWNYAVKPRLRQIQKKLQKQSTISAHTDSFRIEQINQVWMQDIEKQIRRAKEQSDLLVVLLHSGGQFNIEPGEYSKVMMDKLFDLGADVIVGNHPHTVQCVENRDGRIAAYSLGGYCMSVSGEYIVHDCLPEYSLALHVDVDEQDRSCRCSAEVLKGTEDKECFLTVSRAERNDSGRAAIIRRVGVQS